MIKSFLINTDELKRMQAKQRQWSDRPKKGGSAFPTWSFLGWFFFFAGEYRFIKQSIHFKFRLLLWNSYFNTSGEIVSLSLSKVWPVIILSLFSDCRKASANQSYKVQPSDK